MIKNRLSTIMGAKRIDKAELARLTGLSYNVIHALYNDKSTRIDFETINKLCLALDCNTQDLFLYIPDKEL